jgi:AbrB family looped-hinge helix DNA binding protein
MEIVTVKTKFQIVIPQHIREKIHVAVGDVLEADVQGGRIVFTPKSLVDRHLAEGLDDNRKGRTHGPYATVDDAIRALDARAKRLVKKKSHK